MLPELKSYYGIAISVTKKFASSIGRVMTGKTPKARKQARWYITLIRLVTKSALVLLVAHVLFTWPSGFEIFSGNTESFKEWVANISLIPTPMWGIISTIIIGIATQEIMSAMRTEPKEPVAPIDNSDESEG